MLSAKQQEDLIKKLGSQSKENLQEMIRLIYSMSDIFSEIQIFKFNFLIGALGTNKMEVALKYYWQLDENERLIFIEFTN